MIDKLQLPIDPVIIFLTEDMFYKILGWRRPSFQRKKHQSFYFSAFNTPKTKKPL